MRGICERLLIDGGVIIDAVVDLTVLRGILCIMIIDNYQLIKYY